MKAKKAAQIPEGAHFHDLRRRANELAAEGGATTRELIPRTGHSTTRAALRSQRARRESDHTIADSMCRNIKSARKRPQGKRARRRERGRGERHAGDTAGGTAA